jgi:hypothetical protein
VEFFSVKLYNAVYWKFQFFFFFWSEVLCTECHKIKIWQNDDRVPLEHIEPIVCRVINTDCYYVINSGCCRSLNGVPTTGDIFNYSGKLTQIENRKHSESEEKKTIGNYVASCVGKIKKSGWAKKLMTWIFSLV